MNAQLQSAHTSLQVLQMQKGNLMENVAELQDQLELGLTSAEDESNKLRFQLQTMEFSLVKLQKSSEEERQEMEKKIRVAEEQYNSLKGLLVQQEQNTAQAEQAVLRLEGLLGEEKNSSTQMKLDFEARLRNFQDVNDSLRFDYQELQTRFIATTGELKELKVDLYVSPHICLGTACIKHRVLHSLTASNRKCPERKWSTTGLGGKTRERSGFTTFGASQKPRRGDATDNSFVRKIKRGGCLLGCELTQPRMNRTN